MNTYTIQIRDRRQTTLPKPLLKQLGVAEGDFLEVAVGKKQVTITSKKRVALAALKEIQAAFARSRVSEATLQRAVARERASQA